MASSESASSSGENRADGILNFQVIERLLALLGSGAGMAASYEQKRRQIGAGLAEIVDADIWAWARSRMRTGINDPVIFDMVDGGFVDDIERARFLEALYDPIVSEAFNHALRDPDVPVADPCARQGTQENGIRTRHIDEAMPEGSPWRTRWRTLSGLDAGVMSMVPLGGSNWSGLGFHRRVGRPPFTAADACAIHMAAAALDSLHRDGTDFEANSDQLFSFRPRERQVLLYLLAGDQTKQIAAKLGISHHTVSDYVKVIYRRLGVNTRTELLRRFLPTASG